MRVDFPGLLIERHRNGTPRVRVRVEGDTSRRIHIPVTPDHPDFAHHYHAARAGELGLPGIGKIVTRKADARQGRNPATGDIVQIPAQVVVSIKVTKSLKDAAKPGF